MFAYLFTQTPEKKAMFDAFCDEPYIAGYEEKTGVWSKIRAPKSSWIALAKYILETCQESQKPLDF